MVMRYRILRKYHRETHKNGQERGTGTVLLSDFTNAPV